MLSDNSNSIPVIRLANVDSNHFQSLVLRNSEPDNTLSRVTGLDTTYADAAKKNLKQIQKMVKLSKTKIHQFPVLLGKSKLFQVKHLKLVVLRIFHCLLKVSQYHRYK